MATLLWALVASVGLVLAALLVLMWRSRRVAVPLVVLPFVFAPFALACLYASRTVINGFRGMASGEPGSLEGAINALSQANEAVLTAYAGVGILLLLLSVSTLMVTSRKGLGQNVRGTRAGAIALVLTGIVLLSAIIVSRFAAPAISVPIAVVALNGETVDPDLPISGESLQPFLAQNMSIKDISARVAQNLAATAIGSFLLLPLSLLAFIVTAVFSNSNVFTRSVALAGLFVLLLAGLWAAERIQYHRGLGKEIVLLASKRH
jgi:hypothetical protein